MIRHRYAMKQVFTKMFGNFDPPTVMVKVLDNLLKDFLLISFLFFKPFLVIDENWQSVTFRCRREVCQANATRRDLAMAATSINNDSVAAAVFCFFTKKQKPFWPFSTNANGSNSNDSDARAIFDSLLASSYFLALAMPMTIYGNQHSILDF